MQTVADPRVRGLRRLPEGLEVHRHLLEAVTDPSDQELIEGMDSTEILTPVQSHGSGQIREPSRLQLPGRG